MSVTYGFYNSIKGDRKYNALEMSSIFDGIIVDGVYMSIGDALTRLFWRLIKTPKFAKTQLKF